MNFKASDYCRFEQNVRLNVVTLCWEWNAKLTSGGYGHFSLGGNDVKAHRASYMLYVGAIPDGLQILHQCDNRKCVNPSHLRLGTHQDNMKEMKERGRGNGPRGVNAHMNKLTPEQVLAIRADPRNPVELAKIYGVAFSNIYRIKNRQAWKWL